MLLLHALVVELLCVERVAIVHAIHRGRVEGIGLFGGIEHTRVYAIGLVLLLLLMLRPRAHGERCALGRRHLVGVYRSRTVSETRSFESDVAMSQPNGRSFGSRMFN